MRWRRISEEEVLTALVEPDKVEETISGRKNVFKKIGERYIKVTLRESNGKVLIISAVDKGKEH